MPDGSRVGFLALPSRNLRVESIFFPAALEPLVRDDLAAVAFLLPPWCTSILLRYEQTPEKGAGPASSSTDEEYRQAAIDIRPSYFEATDTIEQRREYLAHEMVHVATAPIADYARETLRKAVPEGLARDLAIEELRRRVEGSVQDLSRSVLRHVASLVMPEAP